MRPKLCYLLGEGNIFGAVGRMDHVLDAMDHRILAELTQNARIPVAELARKVGLSKTPVALRIRHLEEIGLITGYRAIPSSAKMHSHQF